MKADTHFAREAKKYDDPIPSREYILDVVADHRALKKSALSKLLGLENAQQKALTYRIKAMLRDKQLSVNSNGQLILFSKKPNLKGKVIANHKGFGFVALENKMVDLRLSNRQMQTVFHGETVLVRRFYDKKEAQILSISKRIKTIVGRILVLGDHYYLQADDRRITQKILIQPSQNETITPNQMVVGKIIRYPTDSQLTIVEISQVLGDYFAPNIEVKSAILRYGIAKKFKQQTLKEVQSLSSRVVAKDRVGRVDLTHLPLVTIDGEDSHDFDDAVCAQKEGKNWRLWVAIADVSHYVKEGTKLDKEAQVRAVSVYFPNEVVPMLPEKLSNGLCSLNPKVLRLCLACELSLSSEAEVQSFKFYPAVMRSAARMTYTELSEILVSKNEGLIKKYQKIYPMLLVLDGLYESLAKKRIQRGAMIIERDESQILFNNKGKISNIVAQKNTRAHRVIEECMLLVNQVCAEFLTRHKQLFLYRVHPKPDAGKLENLGQFLAALNINFSSKASPQDFAQLSIDSSSRDDAHLIQTMILQSMQQASYSPNNIGHFGLAYPSYTHFTSPIRRYPDLLAHRAVKRVLSRQKGTQKISTNIAELGRHCSEKERSADEASRDVQKWLKCEFMSHRLGRTYHGVISKIMNFGLFVELGDLLIDGLVPIASLKDDYYLFNQQTQSLTGRTHGKTYTLGDSLTVKVADVNVLERKIDLAITKDKKRTTYAIT